LIPVSQLQRYRRGNGRTSLSSKDQTNREEIGFSIYVIVTPTGREKGDSKRPIAGKQKKDNGVATFDVLLPALPIDFTGERKKGKIPRTPKRKNTPWEEEGKDCARGSKVEYSLLAARRTGGGEKKEKCG